MKLEALDTSVQMEADDPRREIGTVNPYLKSLANVSSRGSRGLAAAKGLAKSGLQR